MSAVAIKMPEFARSELVSEAGRKTYFKEPDSGPDIHDYEPAPFELANKVSSLCEDGMHKPVLDLDVRHVLVQSSTPGHAHLYIDTAMSWEDYQELLTVLNKAGIISQGFYDMAMARGQTMVRKPGVVKQQTMEWGDSSGSESDRGSGYSTEWGHS